MTVDEVIKKYIELRDRKAALAKKQAEEMQPLSEAMMQIENWLMHQMNTMGVDQFKSKEYGTAFRATQVSVQMKDPAEFRQFVFDPAIDSVFTILNALGVGQALSEVDREKIADVICSMPRWDLVDFRCGKKGIQEMEQAGVHVPGVAINSVATINIRRA